MVTILIALLILVLVLYIFNAFIPMESRIKTVVNIIVVIIFVLWLLRGLPL